MTSIQINRYNFETLELVRRNMELWKAEYVAQGTTPPNFYVIDVSFEAIADDADRQHYATIPTTFDLDDADVDGLRALGGRLLRESPEYCRRRPSASGPEPLSSKPRTLEP